MEASVYIICYSDYTTIGTTRWSEYTTDIDFGAKNGVLLGSVFRQKVRLLCFHPTVGMSIANIYDRGDKISKARHAEVNILPSCVHRERERD